MDERAMWASSHAVVLLAVLAGITFVSGFWGVIIALAPAAYYLVFFPHKKNNSPRSVIGSHVTALFTGWVAYSLLAHGIAPTSVEPMSEAGLRIVGSAVLAFVGSTAGFYALHVNHPMAYVTTFTAAIGAFPTVEAFAVGVGAILVVGGLQAFRRKFGPDSVEDAGVLRTQYLQS